MATPKRPFNRLPTSVVPIHYDITLKPHLDKFTFDGYVNITVHVKSPTTTITLNANELTLAGDSITISYADIGKSFLPTNLVCNESEENVVIHFEKELPLGEATLNLKYHGVLNDKLCGFYRSKYTAADGTEKYAAVTQFEATDARRAFPCWDEPAHKATFDISLVIPNDGKTRALSNMPIVSEITNNIDGRKVVKFDRSPIMSTYLVAFVVGEFDYIESQTEDGVNVRVYARVGKAEQGRFALDVTTKSLDFYRAYFNIAYPLKKLDLIAIADFACGAMENWGLVTYRETCLLVDPENTSTIRRQNVALTVSHELAHQWFGNLVTMEWWTHLWLNEGFASFIEYLCVDYLFPNYNIWNQFVADVYMEAMELDALNNSHPIEVPVGHPSEVDEIFDNISYSKGASVIRMLHKYIGDELFRKGMNHYLSTHSYQNTQTEQLWDALEKMSQKPIRYLMTGWTKQMGYPVISVTATTDPTASTPTQQVTLTQTKFSFDSKNDSTKPSSQWVVPLQFITEAAPKNPTSPVLMETEKLTIDLPVGENQWFKLNPGTVGLYRVSYEPKLLQKFLPAITSQSLDSLDRLNLLNDLEALVMEGSHKADDLFRFMAAYQDEKSYTVWYALNTILARFDQLFADYPELRNAYRTWGRLLLNASVLAHVGWEPKTNEQYLDTLLRSLIINRLVSLGDEAILNECDRIFNAYLTNKTPISPDIRASVYRGVAIRANEKTFEDLLKLHREADLQEEKNRIASALGAVSDPKLIERALNFSISDDIRSQDTVFVLGAIANNSLGRLPAWQFFVNNKELFSKRYRGGFLLSRLVTVVTQNFTTEKAATEITQFFAANSFPGTERVVSQSVETIRLNGLVLQRNMPLVRQFFGLQ